MARLGYHAMRLAWCRAALRAFLRRWAIYLLVGAALAGAASSGGVDAVRALAAWTVLPLLRATVSGDAWLAAAIAAYVLAAGVLVRALRSLLWPVRWALAERALPLQRGEVLRSDVVVVALALAPLFLLYAVGAQALLAADPAWLHGTRRAALLALATMMAGSFGVGIAALQDLRRASATVERRRGSIVPPVQAAARLGASPFGGHWLFTLVALPLRRGPALRTGKALVGALALLLVPVVLVHVVPGAAAWCLAAFALASLAATSRLRTLAREEFAPLRAASLPLPVSAQALARCIAALPVLPVLVAAPAVLTALPLAARRGPVLVAFAIGSVLAAVLEASRAEPSEPVAAASRWLVSLAVLVALASEALP